VNGEDAILLFINRAKTNARGDNGNNRATWGWKGRGIWVKAEMWLRERSLKKKTDQYSQTILYVHLHRHGCWGGEWAVEKQETGGIKRGRIKVGAPQNLDLKGGARSGASVTS